MNKALFFFCFSTAVLILSVIVICISPIINNFEKEITDNTGTYTQSFSKWRTLNCQFFADQENSDTVELDDIQKYKKLKTLCNRKKAMHDLEFASLIINVSLGFICANLGLLHFLNVGKDFEKKTGIIGFITGIIGFVITLVYVCYNGYIFNNDVAFGEYDLTSGAKGGIIKLFSNGAQYKLDSNKYITVYENEKDDYAEFIKFKELGEKQYNYDSKYYKSYQTELCKIPAGFGNTVPISSPYRPTGASSDCNYLYSDALTSFENKDLYDRWLTTLILGIIISLSNVGLLIFGILLFKNGGGESNEPQTVAII